MSDIFGIFPDLRNFNFKTTRWGVLIFLPAKVGCLKSIQKNLQPHTSIGGGWKTCTTWRGWCHKRFFTSVFTDRKTHKSAYFGPVGRSKIHLLKNLPGQIARIFCHVFPRWWTLRDKIFRNIHTVVFELSGQEVWKSPKYPKSAPFW